jgi:hypothetical protein
LPVVAGSGCRYTPYTASPEAPEEMADALERCLRDIARKPKTIQRQALDAAACFDLAPFAARMTEIYQEAIHAN